MTGENSALTRDDPRYKEMFNVEKEIEHSGGVMLENPYPDFARLRSQGSVFAGSLMMELTGRPDSMSPHRPHFTALSFDACSKALVDADKFSSAHYQEQASVMHNIGHTVLTMIGNEHARYRAAVQPMMTRDQAMGWWTEKWIEPFVNILLDELAKSDTVDLMPMLCGRLPMHTVTAAYGLGSDEALEFRDNLLTSMAPVLPDDARAVAHDKVRKVLLGAIAQRRDERRDDLISRMIDAPFTDADGQPSHLDDEAILSFSRLLLLAGGGTTFRQLGITIFALLSDRDQLEDLRADRSLMQQAIEESVRWNCTDPLFYRLAMRDTVLDGHDIPEGAIIDCCLGAANRDPERWEDPDRYDMHRPAKRHVGFAAGPHTCLGRFVAAAEMTAAINALLDRFPAMRLAEGGEPVKVIGGLVARGVNHLPVRLH